MKRIKPSARPCAHGTVVETAELPQYYDEGRPAAAQLGFWGGHVLGSASVTRAVRHGMRSSTRAERWARGPVMWLEEGVRSGRVERIGKRAYFLKWQLLAALEALHSSDLSLMMSSNATFEACSLYLASDGKMILFSLARSPSRRPTNVKATRCRSHKT